jgi:hypothetical protein
MDQDINCICITVVFIEFQRIGIGLVVELGIYGVRWVWDTEQHIFPLKFLQTIDVKYIDAGLFIAVEKEQKVGPLKDSRRYLTDMRFLCKLLTQVITNLDKL